ncbi:MAG: hypothetical protein CMB99_03370 [Flavobacteriaceae bacterium]|nr:hypothetical protein [Flavobacteriaceae bacterium]|tara:strand:+ start:1735 stop:1920 length:186 start_codon:yes stop_codon:yes gene_type:complete
MKFQFKLNFFQIVVLIILGAALLRDFDFEAKKFEKPALAFIYGVVFLTTLFSVFFKKIERE